MKEQDRARFRANLQWFNQFFDGMRNIYALIVEQLPVDFFPTNADYTSENYRFPRQKVIPSIPPYYALLVEGYQCGLQVITIMDANLIARNGFFFHEPSIVCVVHDQAIKNIRLDDFAFCVIGNRDIDLIRKVNSMLWGHIKSPHPADFFAFQVPVDRFSEADNLQKAVQQYITEPITENLRKGFSSSAS